MYSDVNANAALVYWSQGRSLLQYRRLYLPLDRCRIDWQMVGRMHNIQLITEWTCENPSNCHSTLWEEQNVLHWKSNFWDKWTHTTRTKENLAIRINESCIYFMPLIYTERFIDKTMWKYLWKTVIAISQRPNWRLKIVSFIQPTV